LTGFDLGRIVAVGLSALTAAPVASGAFACDAEFEHGDRFLILRYCVEHFPDYRAGVVCNLTGCAAGGIQKVNQTYW
jgi:hypothetical protein